MFFAPCLALTLVLCLLYWMKPAPLAVLDNYLTDIIEKTNLQPDKWLDAVVVDLDDKSLNELGQWPWPRYRLAKLLGKINDQSPSCVALAMILSEPDRTSPKTWQDDIRRELGYEIQVDGIPEELIDYDSMLTNVLKQGPFVLGYEFLFNGPDIHKELVCTLHPLKVAEVQKARPSSVMQIHSAVGCIGPMKEFALAVPASGFLNVAPDQDGAVRRIPLIMKKGERYFPSLILAALMEKIQADQVIIGFDRQGQHALFVGGRSIPVDNSGNMRILNNSPDNSIMHVSAGDVIGNRVPAGLFKDKVVLIGSTAFGLGEQYNIPNDSMVGGVEIIAAAAAALMKENYIFRPPFAAVIEYAAAFAFTIILCLLLPRFGLITDVFVVLGSMSGIGFGARAYFLSERILISPLLPWLAIAITTFAILLIQYRFKEHLALARVDETSELLRDREAMLDSIVNTIPDVVYRLDQDGRISFISASVEQYGFEPGDLLGRKIMNLVFPDDRERARYRVNERRTGARATSGFEVRMHLNHEDDYSSVEVRHFSVSAEGLYRKTELKGPFFMGTQGIARDITTRKQLEHQLLQSQKMEAVGVLASGIAHDFNNILQIINGCLHLIQSEKSDRAAINKYVEELEAVSERGAELIKRLMVFGRKVEPVFQPLDLGRVVNESVRILERTIPKMINIEAEMEQNLPLILGDMNQLEQAMLNIGMNARDAMPDGGTIRFGISINNYGNERSAGQHHDKEDVELIKLTISDTGHGIPESYIDRIFEPFFTTKEIGRGTGLGLSMVYSIIQAHSGEITCESRPGQGTEFTITFPVFEEEADSAEPEVVGIELMEHGSGDILLVDDEINILDAVKESLEQFGYKVHAAENGEDALDQYRRFGASIGLVLLDLNMPGMGGKKCLEELKKISRDVKVVIASGYLDEEVKREILDLGADEFLNKPYRLQAMLKLIGVLMTPDENPAESGE